MGAIKKNKPKHQKKFQKPKIEYPPVPTKKWIPPDKRPKPPKPDPAYVKPKNLTVKLQISSLKKIWNHFEIVENIGILLGHYSQTSKKFSFKSNGYQGACMGAMACIFAHQFNMSQWSSFTVDKILDMGDKLYSKTIQNPGDQCLVEVPPNKVFNSVFMNRQKISFLIDDEGKTVSKVLSLAEDKVKEVFRNALENFLKSFPSGIFFLAGKSLAIWIQKQAFYLFDPTEHDEMGNIWKGVAGWGLSVVYRCKTLDALTDQLFKNVSVLSQNTQFEIYGFTIQRVLDIRVKPPENLEKIVRLEKTKSMVIQDNFQEHPKHDFIEKKCSFLLKEEQEASSLKVKLEELSPHVALGATQIEKRPSWLPEGSVEKTDACRFPIPYKTLKQKISYYNEIVPEKIGILRATTCQTDKNLSKYGGRQSMGNAISALIMLRLYNSIDWVPSIVNKILNNGDRLYRDAMVSIPRSQSLKLSNFQRKTEYEGNLFSPVIEDYSLVGRLQSQDFDVLDLHTALENFLSDNVCCVIVGPLTVAIWIETGKLFMFDPNERDKDGKSVEQTLGFDRNLIPIQYTPGTACVLWFDDLKDLVNLYMHNVEKSKRGDTFFLSRVIIENYMEIPENWFNFKGLEMGKWILRGTLSQSNEKFSDISRNLQSPAICLTALAYRALIPLKDWTTETVDEILERGDNLYRDSIKCLQKNEKFEEPLLMLSEILPKYNMKEKQVHFQIHECFLNGTINSKGETGILDLKRGLEKFFEDDDCAILTCRNISMGLWSYDDYYYYFDSHNRNDRGFSINYGTACIVRTQYLDDISKLIEANLGPSKEDLFNINKITMTFFELLDDDTIEPPLNHYNKTDPGKAILRSLYSEISPKYGINSGKQTIPMCMMALAFNRLKPSADWSKADLDEILNKGDNLYLQVMDDIHMIEAQQQPNSNLHNSLEASPYLDNENDNMVPKDSFRISTDNVKNEFTIGLNRFNLEFESVEHGNIRKELMKSLKTFLKNSSRSEEFSNYELLLESKPLSVAIWRDENVYYLFDSKPRDKKGYAVNIQQWLDPAQLDDEGKKPTDAKSEVVVHTEPNTNEDIKDINKEKVKAVPNVVTEKKEVKIEGDVQEADAEKETNVIDLEPIPEGEPATVSFFGEQEEEEGGISGEEQDLLDKEYPLVKKNSTYWMEREKAGKAYTMWFTDPGDLVNHVFNNIPAWETKTGNFDLKLVKLKNTVLVKDKLKPDEEMRDMYQGDWYFFREIEHGKWILRGTMTIFSETFPQPNRGKQSIPTCYAALAIARIFGMICFNNFSVDSILSYGDKLYTYVRKFRKEQLLKRNTNKLSNGEIDWLVENEEFEIGDVPKKICISNFMVSVEVEPEVVEGDIKAQNFEEVLDVKRGMEKFFETRKFGIVQAKGLNLAIWRGQKAFYMFDSQRRGPNGVTSPYGTACVLRYLNVNQMANDVLQNVPQYGKNMFVIHNVNMTKQICPREKQPKILKGDLPTVKDGGFINVIPGKKIVRGSITQEDPKFGKQSSELSGTTAVIALTMTLLHKTETWSKSIINDIIELGNELYEESKASLRDEFDPWEDKIDLETIKKDFNIGLLKMNFELRLTTQSGIMDSKRPAVPNLRKCIEIFFEENTHGILVSDPLTLAIWEETNSDPLIYIFDPNPRSPAGMPLFNGTACLVSFVNATMAADHIMSCIIEPELRSSTFTIFPVEIVIGGRKTGLKTKRVVRKSVINVLPRCSKLVASQEKRTLRKIAEHERRKKEIKRINQLGRKGFYVLSKEEAILRGYHLRNSDINNNSDISNCIVAIVVHHMTNIEKWNSHNIDLILDIGDQLYIDSYIAYGPKDKKLGLENILRKFYMNNLTIHITVYQPIVSELFVISKIANILQIFFQQETFCMITYMNQWVSVFFKKGLFYMFDPHGSNLQGDHVKKGESGSAVLMRFTNLETLAVKLFHNFFVTGESSARMFTVYLIDVSIKN